MEYAKLGRSGLRVSRISLGTMNFGLRMDEPDSIRVLSAAIDAGINVVDTADVYGGREHPGLSETIVGNWLTKSPSNRDRIILATKVYGTMGAGANDARLSAYHIAKACEASLKRLKTDHIDLYQMHHVDRETPWEEIWQAFEKLTRDGKILYAGSSNFPAWQIAKANEKAERRHFLGLVSEQSVYNLCERTVELEVLPACRDYGLGFFCWSPLSGGLLAGSPAYDERWSESRKANWRKHKAKLEKWAEFCRSRGEHPERAALAWLLGNPLVCSVVIGPSSETHVKSAVEALGAKPSEQDLRAIDEILPGPGGPAPEAYAW